MPAQRHIRPRTRRAARAQVRIGRHSASRGITPEIDLTGPPEDPGVSHLHAVLLPTPDGSWTIVDPGSTNGTQLNDDPEPIATNSPVPLHDGDASTSAPGPPSPCAAARLPGDEGPSVR
ncbi:MAG: FHA domain-containing protein [Egibacteraceae bacterium]